jgi:hypothetical protein
MEGRALISMWYTLYLTRKMKEIGVYRGFQKRECPKMDGL